MANIDHPNRYNDYNDPNIGLDDQEYDEMGNPIFPEDEDDDEDQEESQNQENVPVAATNPNNNQEQREEQINNLRNNINPPTAPENNAVPPIIPTEQPRPDNNPEQLRHVQNNEQQRPLFDHARVVEQLQQQLNAHPAPPVRPKGFNNTIKFYWNQAKDKLNNTEPGKAGKAVAKVLLAGGITIGALTVTSAGMLTSGGLAIFALPIAYSIATRYGIDGVLQLGQQAVHSLMIHRPRINGLKSELENRINQYRELSAREEQNEETVQQLERLAHEAQDFSAKIAECKSNFCKTEAKVTAIRKTVSTVSAIGLGLFNGLPIGYQDFNVRDGIYHMSRVSIRGLEFLYNAGEVIPSTVQTGSTLLGSTTHALALKEIPPQLVISLVTTSGYMGYKLFQNIKNIGKAYNVQAPTFEGILSWFSNRRRRDGNPENQNQATPAATPANNQAPNQNPVPTAPNNQVNNPVDSTPPAQTTPVEGGAPPAQQSPEGSIPTPVEAINAPALDSDMQRIVDKYQPLRENFNDQDIQTNLINEIISQIDKHYRQQLTDFVDNGTPINLGNLKGYRDNLVKVFEALNQPMLWTKLMENNKFNSDKVLKAFKDSTFENLNTGNQDLDLMARKLLANDLLDKESGVGKIMKDLPQQIEAKCKAYLEEVAKDGASNLNLSEYYKSLKIVFVQIERPQLWENLKTDLKVGSNPIVAKFIDGKDLLEDAPNSKFEKLNIFSRQCHALQLLGKKQELDEFIVKNFQSTINVFRKDLCHKIEKMNSQQIMEYISKNTAIENDPTDGKYEYVLDSDVNQHKLDLYQILNNIGYDDDAIDELFKELIKKSKEKKDELQKIFNSEKNEHNGQNARVYNRDFYLLKDYVMHDLLNWKITTYDKIDIFVLKALALKQFDGTKKEKEEKIKQNIIKVVDEIKNIIENLKDKQEDKKYFFNGIIKSLLRIQGEVGQKTFIEEMSKNLSPIDKLLFDGTIKDLKKENKGKVVVKRPKKNSN